MVIHQWVFLIWINQDAIGRLYFTFYIRMKLKFSFYSFLAEWFVRVTVNLVYCGNFLFLLYCSTMPRRRLCSFFLFAREYSVPLHEATNMHNSFHRILECCKSYRRTMPNFHVFSLSIKVLWTQVTEWCSRISLTTWFPHVIFFSKNKIFF